jgi:hypothetical protein
VPWKLRRQVYEALSRLTENDPLCVNAEIGGFVSPVSNELSRVVAMRSGVMIPTDEKTPQGHNRLDCHAPWDGYFEAISCPEGYFCDSEQSVELSCERLKLHCPAGLHCVCRPCIQDMVLYMYPVQVLYPVAELFESANAFLCRALVTFISSIKFIGFLFNAFCTFHFDNVLGQQHAMSCSKLIFSPVSHDPYCSSSMTRPLVSHSPFHSREPASILTAFACSWFHRLPFKFCLSRLDARRTCAGPAVWLRIRAILLSPSCVFTSFAAAQVVAGLCVSLFVAALFLTIFWRVPLEGASLTLGRRRVKQGLFKRSRDVA